MKQNSGRKLKTKFSTFQVEPTANGYLGRGHQILTTHYRLRSNRLSSVIAKVG